MRAQGRFSIPLPLRIATVLAAAVKAVGGWLRVVGRAPDELRWYLRGQRWDGPRPAER
jgi:hypothetical protein